MAEPLTTLTDYAIALECLVFAGLLLGRGRDAWLWAAVFISVSGAAMLGGTYHGFAAFLSWPQRLWLWQGIGLGLSITSFLAVLAAASPLGWSLRLGLFTLATAKLALVLGLGSTLWAFALRVADYMSALVIVLLVQLGQRLHQQHPKAQPGWMAAGIAISGLAASVLILPWPRALAMSPMAGYHLVQMVALYCIYRSVKVV